MMLFLGLLLATLIWLLLFGLNLPIRWMIERRHHAQHEVLARFELPQPKEDVNLGMWVAFPIVSALIHAYTMYEHWDPQFWTTGGLLPGMLYGAWLFMITWPLYVRGRTRSREIFILDKEGMTVLPPRTGRVTAGSFRTRIEWKDCLGFSVYKGGILFALKPFGHVEQEYGPHRDEVLAALHLLGVQKLNAYDMLAFSEATDAELEKSVQRVLDMAHDVVSGYQTELTSLGMRVEVDHVVVQEEPAEEEYAYLRLALWAGEEQVADLDWLLWARYGESVEVLRLPQSRLYEALDERVQSMVESRLRELEVAKSQKKVH
ncbi:MAG: hypothetical protein WCC10_02500 [Tumebacillaceae bacterium]